MRISDWSSDVFSSDLSIPAALAVAHGALARIGVLALRPDALETLADASDVVFDKTGTLSDGRPRRAAVETFGGFDAEDRQRGVEGRGVDVRVDRGGRRTIKKNIKQKIN